MLERRRILTSPPLTFETETGAPCEFTAAFAAPLRSCVVEFAPVQTGTGTPAPDNVMPISGWTGITLTNGEDEVSADWSSDLGTVYGGAVDLITGEMTITHAGVSFRWGDVDVYQTLADGAYVEKRALLPDGVRGGGAGAYSGCSVCPYLWDEYNGNPHWYIDDGAHRIATIFLPSGVSDDTVVTIYGTYATPESDTVTPVPVSAAKGENSIESSSGGTVTATYWTIDGGDST